MYKIIKGFHILEKETGKMLKFTGSMVGKLSSGLDNLGTEILEHLEAQKFIARHTQEDTAKPTAKNTAKDTAKAPQTNSN